MIEATLSILLAVYLLVGLLLAGVVGLGVYKSGGFAGFAVLANMTSSRRKYTATNVKVLLVMAILLWPIVFAQMSKTR